MLPRRALLPDSSLCKSRQPLSVFPLGGGAYAPQASQVLGLVDFQARHVAQELRPMLKVMCEKPGQVPLAPLESPMKGSGLSSTNLHHASCSDYLGTYSWFLECSTLSFDARSLETQGLRPHLKPVKCCGAYRRSNTGRVWPTRP